MGSLSPRGRDMEQIARQDDRNRLRDRIHGVAHKRLDELITRFEREQSHGHILIKVEFAAGIMQRVRYSSEAIDIGSQG